MLELLIERVRQSESVEDIWVATTTHPSDQAIVDACQRFDVSIYRGSEENVLQRVVECALASKTDLIVELTGDNPLIDPRLIDDLVVSFKESQCDFATNVFKPGFTLGMVAQVVTTNLLQKVASLTSDPLDQEHVTRYIHSHPEQFSIFHLDWPKGNSRPELRLTLDTPQDYKLIRTLFEMLYLKNPNFNFEAICEFLDSNPELLKINQHIVQKFISN